MQLIRILRIVGWLCFGLAWIPFTLMFVAFGVDSLNFLAVPMIVMMVILFGVAMTSLILTPILGGIMNQAVRDKGIEAMAIILTVTNTGTTINDNPLVRFLLEVHAPGYDPFPAEAEQIVSYFQVSTFQPGSQIRVKCDPETKRVAII